VYYFLWIPQAALVLVYSYLCLFGFVFQTTCMCLFGFVFQTTCIVYLDLYSKLMVECFVTKDSNRSCEMEVACKDICSAFVSS
jgi:hypothetical protein